MAVVQQLITTIRSSRPTDFARITVAGVLFIFAFLIAVAALAVLSVVIRMHGPITGVIAVDVVLTISLACFVGGARTLQTR